MSADVALPDADQLQRAALRVAIQEALAQEAKANLVATRSAAQILFAPARNHGTPQVELTLADGTKVGLISIEKGGTSATVDEDQLFLIAVANDPHDVEDHVLPAVLTDPRALELLSEHLPDLVGRRINADARALYDKEIEDNAGKVLDRAGILGPAGERVQVAEITHHEATGKFSVRPTTKGWQQIREALDAGHLGLDGSYTTPPEPDPATEAAVGEPAPVTDLHDAGQTELSNAEPAKAEDTAARLDRALSHGPMATRGKAAGPEPTGEQQAVLDAVKTGGNVVIAARAGTGKTTVLTMIAREQRGQQGLYLAFNRAIVADAKPKFGRSVTVCTAHSMAMSAVGHAYRGRLNGPRVPANQAARILRINEPLRIDKDRSPLSPAQQARIVLETVGRFCRSADPELDERHIPYKVGLNTPEIMDILRKALTSKARLAWGDLTLNDELLGEHSGEHLRFDHDVYLKLWGLSEPQLPYRYLLYDEAQDADAVIQAVVLGQQDTQLIAVGDEAQAIYEWRGAVNAMATFPAEHRLTLSQSFRFGSAIAREANKWLEALDSEPQVRGSDRISSMICTLERGHAVLCRTNAGTISEVLKTADAGHKAAIVGGGKDIRALAEAARDLKLGKGTAHPELYAFSTWAEVQDHAENDPTGTDLRVLVQLVDDHGPDAIIRIIDSLVDESVADVVVSTAHKAKGREWQSVRVSDDFRPPAEGSAISPGEARLAYVTVTRAKGSLDRGSLAYIDQFAGLRGAAA